MTTLKITAWRLLLPLILADVAVPAASTRTVIHKPPGGRLGDPYLSNPFLLVSRPPKTICAHAHPVKLQAFENWAAYHDWRWGISSECARQQPVQPCVYGKHGWACLPKLIIAGAEEAAAYVLSEKLASSGRVITGKSNNGERAAQASQSSWHEIAGGKAGALSNSELAQLWAEKDGQFDASLAWTDLVDNGSNYAKQIGLDLSPSYLRVLLASDLRRMLDVNPDAHFVVLVRDPAQAFIKSALTSLCRAPTCGELGCEVRAPMYPAIPEGRRTPCPAPETPCEAFMQEINSMTVESLASESMHADPAAGFLLRDNNSNREATPSNMTRFGPWRYAYMLHREWLQVVPRHQIHILQSEFLLKEPQKALNQLGRQLKLEGPVRDMNALHVDETTHLEQPAGSCLCPEAPSNTQLMLADAKRCRVRDMVRCAHLEANRLLEALMRYEFKSEWKESPIEGWSSNMNQIECQKLGFYTDVPGKEAHTLAMRMEDSWRLHSHGDI